MIIKIFRRRPRKLLSKDVSLGEESLALGASVSVDGGDAPSTAARRSLQFDQPTGKAFDGLLGRIASNARSKAFEQPKVSLYNSAQ